MEGQNHARSFGWCERARRKKEREWHDEEWKQKKKKKKKKDERGCGNVGIVQPNEEQGFESLIVVVLFSSLANQMNDVVLSEIAFLSVIRYSIA